MSCPECGGALIPMVDGSFCLSCESPKTRPASCGWAASSVRPRSPTSSARKHPKHGCSATARTHRPHPGAEGCWGVSADCPIHGDNALLGHDPKFKIGDNVNVRFQGGVAMSTVEVAEGMLRGSPEFSREEIAEIFGIPPDLLPRNRR